MISKSEWNRKVAISRWSKVLGKKAKQFEFNSLHYPHLKARIVAYLMGDGSVSVTKERNCLKYDISFYPDNDVMLNSYLYAINKVYGVIPHIRKEKGHFRARITSKPIGLDLLKYGPYKSLYWKVPINQLKSRLEKQEWLRAFCDCEGYVGPKVITIQSVNQIGLKQIQILLREFGIESRFYSYKRKQITWNINYLLCIAKKENRTRFLKEIGFNHSSKQEKLLKFAGVAESG